MMIMRSERAFRQGGPMGLLAAGTMLLLLFASPLAAQNPSPLVKYGNWGKLGASPALNALAIPPHYHP